MTPGQREEIEKLETENRILKLRVKNSHLKFMEGIPHDPDRRLERMTAARIVTLEPSRNDLLGVITALLVFLLFVITVAAIKYVAG